MAKSLILKKEIFELIEVFESYSSPMEFEQFKSIVNMSEESLLESFSLINEVLETDIHIEVKNDKQWLHYPVELPEVSLKFSAKEWLSVLEHRESIPQTDRQSSLFWMKIEMRCQSHGFESFSKAYENIQSREKALTASEWTQIHTSKIDKAIRNKQLVKVKMKNNEVSLFAHKVLYVDSEIHLVGEESSEHCLIFTPLKNIENVEILKKSYKPFYSSFEVSEFVDSILSLSDESIRLVLKIKCLDSFDEEKSSYFLGRPYVISNERGETIWAATVNKSQELIDWIIGLGDSVEVLDPTGFKNEIQNCLEQVYMKKAS